MYHFRAQYGRFVPIRIFFRKQYNLECKSCDIDLYRQNNNKRGHILTKEHKNESFLVSFKGRECNYCTQCSFRIYPEKVSTYFVLPIIVLHCGKYEENC